MSWHVTAWAVSKKTGSASGKAVLMTLASYAGESGETYVSIPRLSEDTEQSPDSVRRKLVELEARGLIARAARWSENGRRQSDWIVMLYCDAAEAFARGLGWAPGAVSTGGGESGAEGESDESGSGKTDAETSAGSAPRNVAASPPEGVTLANCEGGTLANCEGGTLANCEGDPSKLRGGDPSKLRGPLRTYIEINNSLCPDASPEHCATGGAGREREDFERIDSGGEDEAAFQASWRKFHDLWRWQAAESPVVARGVFRALSAADRAAATAMARRYVEACAAAGRRQAYAGNWLKQRGFEDLAVELADEKARLAQVKADLHARQREKYGGIVIRRREPQGAAWIRHELATTGARPAFGRVGPFDDAIVRASEWPPAAGANARDGPDRAA